MRHPFRLWLLLLFLITWAMSCIGAASYADLALQHVLTVALVVALVLHARGRPLNDASYLAIFAYMLLHLVGARYLYSFVPYDDWLEASLGVRLEELFRFERNHYDRLVHTCFGLLFMLPIRELVERWLRPTRAASLILAVGAVVVLSTLYELLEWIVAMVLAPEASEKYNGQQGDVWDAHRDTALALIGAVVTAVVMATKPVGCPAARSAARVAPPA